MIGDVISFVALGVAAAAYLRTVQQDQEKAQLTFITQRAELLMLCQQQIFALRAASDTLEKALSSAPQSVAERTRGLVNKQNALASEIGGLFEKAHGMPTDRRTKEEHRLALARVCADSRVVLERSKLLIQSSEGIVESVAALKPSGDGQASTK